MLIGGIAKNAGTTRLSSDVRDFPSTIVAGAAELEPLSVMIEKVSIDAPSGRHTSADSYFVFRVRVRNRSESKRLEFTGWPANQFLVNCGMLDEHGNAYKVITFGIGSTISDVSKPGTLEPGEVKTTAIAFEKPIDAAKEVRVQLNGDGLDKVTPAFAWKIKRQDWEQH